MATTKTRQRAPRKPATPGDPKPGALKPVPDVPETPAAETRQDTPAPGPAPEPEQARTGKAPKEPRPPKERGLCVHGCGLQVERPGAQFVRGHDSKYASELRKAYAAGTKTADQLREEAVKVSARFAGKIDRAINAVDTGTARSAGAGGAGGWTIIGTRNPEDAPVVIAGVRGRRTVEAPALGEPVWTVHIPGSGTFAEACEAAPLFAAEKTPVA